MVTRIQIKRKTVRTNQIPNNLINLQKQAHDYLANFLNTYNFKKNKFYVSSNIEIAPAKQRRLEKYTTKYKKKKLKHLNFVREVFEFGSGWNNIRNYADAYYYVWVKDKKLARNLNSTKEDDEIMLRVSLWKPTKKNKYPRVDFGIEHRYSSFMDYKPLIEHNQVKRANGKIDKYFTSTYRFVDNANNFRKFLNLIVLDTRVEWVRKYKSLAKYSNGYPT